MNDRDVASIVRSAIVDRGLPFTVLTVSASASGWHVRLREQAGGIVSLTLPDGRPVDMRIAVQEQLEAQC